MREEAPLYRQSGQCNGCHSIRPESLYDSVNRDQPQRLAHPVPHRLTRVREHAMQPDQMQSRTGNERG